LKTNWLGLLIFLALIVSCSGIRRVRPLDDGESALSASVGGPVTQVGSAWLPLPLLSIGYAYGLNRHLSLEGGVNLTSALFGLAHIDAGLNWYAFEPRGAIPGITVTPKLVLISNFAAAGTRFYPTVTPTVYWNVGRHVIYTGAENWFELHSQRSDGNTQPHHWLAVPYLGFGLSRGKWLFQVEGRVYTPNLKNTGRATKNIGFGDYGAVGGFIGVGRTFGESR
jgi:hypothetical protein